MPVRETFWNIPHWAEIGQYLLALLAVLVFVYGFVRRVQRWRSGQAERRIGRLGQRLVNLVQHGLIQRRTAREPYPGAMHLAIFWGMIALALGTALATVDWEVTRLLFGFRFLRGSLYLVFEFALDVMGLAALLGLMLAAWRRYVIRPPRLHALPGPSRSWEEGLILGGLVLVVVTGYLIEGLRLAVVQPSWAQWSPVGSAVARLFRGLPEATARSAHLALWIIHGLAAFALLGSLPFTKLAHLLLAPLNILLAPPAPSAALAPARTSGAPGVRAWREFTWKQLLDFDACVRCGRCQDQCPAFASGTSLSPRDLMLKLQAHVWSRSNGARLHGEVVSEAELWACTSCRACVQACPVFTDQLAVIVDLRRHLVNEGRMDVRLQEALANLGRYGNSFGLSERGRAKWTQAVEIKVKDARREPVEVLWFVGDYASYNATVADATRKTAAAFARAGLDFGILYDGERNAGNDARRVGEEGLFEMLREKNAAALAKCSFQAVVTTDPHTLNTLKHEYPSLGNGDVPIWHHSEVFSQAIAEGRVKFSKKLGYRITYHDPCYLGRYNGVYDAPRRVIRATGCELVEMPRHGDRAFCCGAGGGRIWMEEGELKERPSESRVREAAGLPGVQLLIVACPKDLVMYQDALKTTGLEGRIMVKELIELVAEAL